MGVGRGLRLSRGLGEAFALRVREPNHGPDSCQALSSKRLLLCAVGESICRKSALTGHGAHRGCFRACYGACSKTWKEQFMLLLKTLRPEFTPRMKCVVAVRKHTFTTPSPFSPTCRTQIHILVVLFPDFQM